jgi:cytoskeletal protein CcmA (bactofilin family)
MSIDKKAARMDIPGNQSYMNSSANTPAAAETEARRLVVGRDISLNGHISNCEYLLVEGTVQADTFVASRMDVLDGGLFNGTAQIQDGVIAGRFEGKLSVAGRLVVKATGFIKGDIEYGALEVETGAKIEGRMSTIAAPVVVPVATAANDEKTESDEGKGDTKGESSATEAFGTSTASSIYRRIAGT